MAVEYTPDGAVTVSYNDLKTKPETLTASIGKGHSGSHFRLCIFLLITFSTSPFREGFWI